MYSSSSSDLAQKSLQIKEDDKFFSRLLSKETSMAYPSFRVKVGVPFLWESKPGTLNPKYSFSESTLIPPLTPPPSFYSNSCNKNPIKKHSRSNLIRILFSRINPRKSSTLVPSSSSSFSSSSSSISSFFPSTPNREYRGRRRFSSCGSSFDSRVYEYDQDAESFGSPASTLCFRARRATKECNYWW